MSPLSINHFAEFGINTIKNVILKPSLTSQQKIIALVIFPIFCALTICYLIHDRFFSTKFKPQINLSRTDLAVQRQRLPLQYSSTNLKTDREIVKFALQLDGKTGERDRGDIKEEIIDVKDDKMIDFSEKSLQISDEVDETPKTFPYPFRSENFKISNRCLFGPKQELLIKPDNYSSIVQRVNICKWTDFNTLEVSVSFRAKDLALDQYLIASGIKKESLRFYQAFGNSIHLLLSDDGDDEPRKMVNIILENNQFSSNDSVEIEKFIK